MLQWLKNRISTIYNDSFHLKRVQDSIYEGFELSLKTTQDIQEHLLIIQAREHPEYSSQSSSLHQLKSNN